MGRPPAVAEPEAAPLPTGSGAGPLRFESKTLVDQVEALAAGRISSATLTATALARASRLQPELRPFRVILEEDAIAAAQCADERLAAGERLPLLGVPVAIKDDVDYAGQTTPFGCGGTHPVADTDSELVRRLKGAGAVIIGKTTTCEVGQWPFSESRTFGSARNPWNPHYSPGGSSGGAAAAVAAGIVAAAIGSDGAGSVRIPAAWCGLVGLKPQRGRISTWPDVDAFHGLACFGPLTRTVGDAAHLLDAIAGPHPEDAHRPRPPVRSFAEAARQAPEELRIAVSLKTPPGVRARLHPEIRDAVLALAERLSGLGHRVSEADPDYGLSGLALIPRRSRGVLDWCARMEVDDHGELEPRTQTALRFARISGAPPVLAAARWAEGPIRRRIGRVFDDYDFVLTPTTAQPPPRVGTFADAGWWKTSTSAGALCPYAFIWNVTGWPALSIPAGTTAAGLPIGAQLLAHEGREDRLLALARQLELDGATKLV